MCWIFFRPFINNCAINKNIYDVFVEIEIVKRYKRIRREKKSLRIGSCSFEVGLKYHTHYILYIKLFMDYEIKKGLKLVWVKFDTLRNSNSNVNECKDNENYTEQWRQNLILLFSTTNFTKINIKKRIDECLVHNMKRIVWKEKTRVF